MYSVPMDTMPSRTELKEVSNHLTTLYQLMRNEAENYRLTPFSERTADARMQLATLELAANQLVAARSVVHEFILRAIEA